MQDGTTDEVRLARMSDTLFIAVLGRDHNNNDNNNNTNFKSVFLHFTEHAAVVRCAAPKTHMHNTKQNQRFLHRFLRAELGLLGLRWKENKRGRIKSVDV